MTGRFQLRRNTLAVVVTLSEQGVLSICHVTSFATVMQISGCIDAEKGKSVVRVEESCDRFAGQPVDCPLQDARVNVIPEAEE